LGFSFFKVLYRNPRMERICCLWLQQKHGESWQEWRPTAKLQVGSRTSKEVLPEDVPLSPWCDLPEYKKKGLKHI
jgi:hypothetical protein